MKPFAMVFLVVPFLAPLGTAGGVTQEDAKLAFFQQPVATPAPDKSKVVYVSDFELDAVDVNGKLEKSVPAIPPSSAAPLDPKREQGQVEKAGRFVDFMSATLGMAL